MLQCYRALHNKPHIKERSTIMPGSWIRCETPSADEKKRLVDAGVDVDIIDDALDPHEVPRVESSNGWTYFITRLPDMDDEFNDFTTPMMFAVGEEQIVTVSQTNLSRLWDPFIAQTRTPTTQKTKLFILMMEAIARQYQSHVALINRQMRATNSSVHRLTAKDIATITEYERKLNDYLDALEPTNTSLQRMITNSTLLTMYEEDKELVEDVTIELAQLTARCKSLLRTITNLRDSYRAVMDTRLNETIRLLTVITVALTIPTMIAGLFGMNVPLPAWADSQVFFWLIVVASVCLAGIVSVYFLKKR